MFSLYFTEWRNVSDLVKRSTISFVVNNNVKEGAVVAWLVRDSHWKTTSTHLPANGYMIYQKKLKEAEGNGWARLPSITMNHLHLTELLGVNRKDGYYYSVQPPSNVSPSVKGRPLTVFIESWDLILLELWFDTRMGTSVEVVFNRTQKTNLKAVRKTRMTPAKMQCLTPCPLHPKL